MNIDFKLAIKEAGEIQAKTAVLLVQRNKLQAELAAMKRVNPENCDGMFMLLLPGRIKATEIRAANLQEQIDFNLAYCEVLLETCGNYLEAPESNEVNDVI